MKTLLSYRGKRSAKDMMRSGGIGVAPQRVNVVAKGMRVLAEEGSEMFPEFKSDEMKAYVEFDICHCLPVITQEPKRGGVAGWHPAVLSKCHSGLVHQQTNLHHQLIAHGYEEDAIVGAIVATNYPEMPEGGWSIPLTEEEAIPIRCCAAVFKKAAGAMDMLTQYQNKEVDWSVSIEASIMSLEDVGIWIPSKRELVTLFEAEEQVLDALEIDDDGKINGIGELDGEQLALVYGSLDGVLIFEGVGFVHQPAEKQAKLTSIRMSKKIATVCASENLEKLMRDAVAKRFYGASVVSVFDKGFARLPGKHWGLAATKENPALHILLRNGKSILKNISEIF